MMLGQDMSACITGTGQPQIVRTPLAAFRVSLPNSTLLRINLLRKYFSCRVLQAEGRHNHQLSVRRAER